MDKLKKVGKSFLFPHTAIMIILLPIATVFLVYSMIFIGEKTMPAYVSYVLAAYTLTVWCMRIPKLITLVKAIKTENKYIRIWTDDVRLRTNVSLYGSFIWNIAYAVFQLCLGLYHTSFWFYSMAVYYLCLAAMRFVLVRHTSRHKPGEKMRDEFIRYRTCGIVFLLLNLILSLMVFFMVYWNKTFHHHEITTIAMATYTFIAFTIAIVNIVKYRKYQSPVFSASKAISLAAACVSMITLTSTMLTTFGEGTDNIQFRRIMLGSLGGAVSAFIIIMAIYMIVKANKEMKRMGG